MSDQRDRYTIVSPGWEPRVILAGVRGRPGAKGDPGIENPISTDGSVSHIVRVTKAEYAAITPDPRTLYFVVE